MSDEALRTSLLDLHFELQKTQVPLILGGGYGLFLRQMNLAELNQKTLIPPEQWPQARSTEDLDLFVQAEVVGNKDHVEAIRNSLDFLGYKPIADYFQFSKTPDDRSGVKLDFLTGPITPDIEALVKKKEFRISCRAASVKFHAYLTEEALSLNESLLEIPLLGKLSTGVEYSANILIPNTFTFLLMKLHAFHDRVNDPKKELGKHHALDIYRIIAMMNSSEYDKTVELLAVHKNARPCQHASFIQSNFFNKKESLGIIRLMEHESFHDKMDVDTLRAILEELFEPVTAVKADQSAKKRSAPAELAKTEPAVAATPGVDLPNWLAQVNQASSIEAVLTIVESFRPSIWSDEERAEMAKMYIKKIDRIRKLD
jgi:hypothetical protein